jgi:hypothetical protein
LTEGAIWTYIVEDLILSKKNAVKTAKHRKGSIARGILKITETISTDGNGSTNSSISPEIAPSGWSN